MTDMDSTEGQNGKGAEAEMKRQRRNLFLISGVLAIVQIGGITINIATPGKQLYPALVFQVGHPFEIGHWVVWLMFGYTVWLFLVYLRRIGAWRQFLWEYRLIMGELFRKRFRTSLESDPKFNKLPMFAELEYSNWTVHKWRVHGNKNKSVDMDICPKTEDGRGSPSALSSRSIMFKRDIKPSALWAQRTVAAIYVGIVSHALLEYVFPLLVAFLAACVPLLISLTR